MGPEDKDGKIEKTEFSGAYGFVIKPDSKTQEKAEILARKMTPNAEFQTKSPHITLFHAQLDKLPRQTIEDILSNLKEHEGENLVLNSFEIYGDKFLFWNVEKIDSLNSMHKKALEIATYLNKEVAAKAIEEGLNMTQEEVENIKKYGHPLVQEKFMPHITLAYDSRGLRLPKDIKIESWSMQIDKIAFAEMGKYGSVSRLVLTL